MYVHTPYTAWKLTYRPSSYIAPTPANKLREAVEALDANLSALDLSNPSIFALVDRLIAVSDKLNQKIYG